MPGILPRYEIEGYNFVSAAHVALPNERVIVDSTAAPFSIGLPTSPMNGQTFEMSEAPNVNQLSTNAVTLVCNPLHTIKGGADTLIINTNDDHVQLTFNTAALDWQAVRTFNGQAAAPVTDPARDLLMDVTGTTLNGEGIGFLGGRTRASIIADYERVEFWIADMKQTGNNQRNDWPIASYPVDALNPNAAGDGIIRINEGLQNIWIAESGLGTTGLTFNASNNDGVYVLKMWGVRPQLNAIYAESAAVPTSFVDHGIWTGVNLNNLVANGMIIGNNSGSSVNGPIGSFTGSCKVTAIGDWIQQDFMSQNATGTDLSERFSRQSFNGGTTWSAWIGQ